jgi:hypothetical protein
VGTEDTVSCVSTGLFFVSLFGAEDGGDLFIRDVRIYLNYTTPDPRSNHRRENFVYNIEEGSFYKSQSDLPYSVSVKLPLYLIKYRAMKTYGEMEV